jgi:predicted nucleic acid-binding protein
MQTVLRSVYEAGCLTLEIPTSHLLSPDPKDQPYIDLALAVQADYLITGNMQGFPDSPYGITQAIKPADFLRLVA